MRASIHTVHQLYHTHIQPPDLLAMNTLALTLTLLLLLFATAARAQVEGGTVPTCDETFAAFDECTSHIVVRDPDNGFKSNSNGETLRACPCYEALQASFADAQPCNAWITDPDNAYTAFRMRSTICAMYSHYSCAFEIDCVGFEE